MNQTLTKKKPVVFLGLSGGVDSAVAAILLKKQGYDVKGMFLKIWSDKLDEDGVCPWVADRLDAIAVAAKLDIPLITLDFEKEYKDEVFAYFVQEYKAGRTPNPDILCNEVIKFGVFLDYALKHGADYIATGHHARRMPEQGNEADQVVRLLAGIDEKKDQSYFLSRLNQHQLSHSLFPIGSLTKAQVRFLAKEHGLDVVADKRSTRGICFIGKVDLRTFLSKYTIEKPGDIVDMSGKVIGSHKGIAFYTIGQRRGLEIPAKSAETTPYFVVSKDAERNRLVVAEGGDEALEKNVIYADRLHWIDGKLRTFPFSCQARIRYHQELQNVTIEFESQNDRLAQRLRVSFDKPQRAVPPGQFVVLYQGDELLGSAIID